MENWSFKMDGNTLLAKIKGREWKDVLSISGLELDEAKGLLRSLAQLYPFMPGYKKSDLTLPRVFLKGDIQESVIFFGGSFNPWHLGHHACLDLCPGENIVVVPDRNPWKDQREEECPWEKFKELAYKLMDNDYSLYPGFLAEDQGNPTVDWLPAVPIEKKWLLLGGDSFISFPKWKEAQKLSLNLRGLYVCPRLEEEEEVSASYNQIKKWNPDIQIVFLGDHEFRHLSSTKLREE